MGNRTSLKTLSEALAIVGLVGLAGGKPWAWGGSGSEAAQFAQAQVAQEEFRWRGEVAPGDEIEIKGVNGFVRATGAAGTEVEVKALKHARKSDPKDVRVEVVKHERGVTICAVYPSRGGKPNECRPGEGGRMNTHDNDVNVDFTVQVPKGVRFVGRTVNGSVDAQSVSGAVEAYTVNGSVSIVTAADAEATTVNGSIRASLGSANWTEAREFQTVNGPIAVTLPTGLNADVRAETVNGDITTDFPLTVTGRFGPRRLSGSIGSGGRELRLQTVNGDIQLRRAS
jgi:hypothetical protein